MKTILYIEDNPANRILIGRLLSRDYNMVYAEDGETGLQLATEQSPDLILMDIGLPDFDGQTVGAMIRQIPELKDVPIVAITAWPEDKANDIVERYGFDGCITKPVSVNRLPHQIAAYFEN